MNFFQNLANEDKIASFVQIQAFLFGFCFVLVGLFLSHSQQSLKNTWRTRRRALTAGRGDKEVEQACKQDSAPTGLKPI